MFTLVEEKERKKKSTIVRIVRIFLFYVFFACICTDLLFVLFCKRQNYWHIYSCSGYKRVKQTYGILFVENLTAWSSRIKGISWNSVYEDTRTEIYACSSSNDNVLLIWNPIKIKQVTRFRFYRIHLYSSGLRWTQNSPGLFNIIIE